MPKFKAFVLVLCSIIKGSVRVYVYPSSASFSGKSHVGMLPSSWECGSGRFQSQHEQYRISADIQLTILKAFVSGSCDRRKERVAYQSYP